MCFLEIKNCNEKVTAAVTTATNTFPIFCSNTVVGPIDISLESYIQYTQQLKSPTNVQVYIDKNVFVIQHQHGMLDLLSYFLVSYV